MTAASAGALKSGIEAMLRVRRKGRYRRRYLFEVQEEAPSVGCRRELRLTSRPV